ncbi:AAA family ATPase [Empedobacter sp. UBA7252]|uniref:AAA family ATPase n=1 Tax=Bacteroidota TaxID=976 RepID=UPI0025BC474E|nr:ATP-binding protein [Empedobacter sp. UBA7252]
MLAKFKVSNFKSFNEEVTFDLTDTNGYTFNKDSIKNDIVNSALVYGHNGVGKSNLGLAIFDIIEHLTDGKKNDSGYEVYLNAYSKKKYAQFSYEFLIEGAKVEYSYRKLDYYTILTESFSINGKELARIDREKNNTAQFNFKGAETLKTEITNPGLSIIKYVKNNTELDKNEENKVFMRFFSFIEGMLFFRSLPKNEYMGSNIATKTNAIEDIIEKNNLRNFEEFLNNAGIECKLKEIDEIEKKTIGFDFDGVEIPFVKIASQGTRSLLLFYYWFQRIKDKEKTLVFIDEFDAFYHHDLSAVIVRELKKTGVQFILTTHNTSIITNDLLRPDCYFLINKHSIRSLSKSTSKELREAHNIEKMYKAGTFDGE